MFVIFFSLGVACRLVRILQKPAWLVLRGKLADLLFRIAPELVR